MSYCTSPDCHSETTLYLCTGCIVELADLIKVVPPLIEMLAGARAGTSVVRNAGSGGGGGAAGSKPPGSLDAMMLQAWLAQLPDSAHAEATSNPDAGRLLFMARLWVRQAEDLVYGAAAEIVDVESLREKVRDAAPPMPTRELLPWLRKNARIAITSMDIRNWARRGKLRPYSLDPNPTYHPHEVLAAWHETRAGN